MASLRDQMPETAAFIDMIRDALGKTPEDLAAINAAIKAGINGQPTFYASENGHQVGTPSAPVAVFPAIPGSLALPKKEKAC